MHDFKTEVTAHAIMDDLHECWAELETRYNLGERITFDECVTVEAILQLASDWSDAKLWESPCRDEMDDYIERVDMALDDLRHTIE